MPVIDRIMTRLGRGASDDRGGALIAVVGVAVVVSIACATVLASSMSGMEVSTSSRAGVQSEAAAEAGIADAELGLRAASGCTAVGGVFAGPGTPAYTATVSYFDLTGWHTGCPDGHPLATQVKVTSVGTAAARGVGAASSGDTTTMEALYPYTGATTSLTGTGPAVFAGSMTSLNNVVVTDTTVETGKTSDIVITSGDYSLSCQGTTTINGSIIVTNGDLKLYGCVVLGGIQVKGFVNINSSTVNGDVVAAGLTGHTTDSGAVGYVLNSVLNGGLSVSGKLYLQSSKVLGSVVGKTLSTVSNVIDPSVKIAGTLNLGGTVDSWGACGILALVCLITKGVVGSLLGSSVQNQNLPAIAAPTAATFTPYSYSAAAWAALGYQIVPWEGPCSVDNNPTTQVFIAKVAAFTTPTVVDARACDNVLFSNSAALRLVLHANVAFVGRAFQVENTTIRAATGLALKTWLIVDGSSGILPNASLCVAASIGTVELNSTVSIGGGVTGLIYTPGCIHNANPVTIIGQEYAGHISQGQSVSIDYQTVGLPGTSLDGTVVVAGTPATLGSRTSLREIAGT